MVCILKLLYEHCLNKQVSMNQIDLIALFGNILFYGALVNGNNVLKM